LNHEAPRQSLLQREDRIAGPPVDLKHGRADSRADHSRAGVGIPGNDFTHQSRRLTRSQTDRQRQSASGRPSAAAISMAVLARSVTWPSAATSSSSGRDDEIPFR